MLLIEYVELSGLTLRVEFTDTRNSGPFIANLIDPNTSYCIQCKESSDDVMLRSCTGWGKTADEAVSNLCKNLMKMKLVVLHYGDKKYIKIPKELTY